MRTHCFRGGFECRERLGMSEQSNNDSGAPPPAKKMFAFRQSALAAKADQLWNQSKSGFGFGVTPSTHVQLEKKSLNDVLGRMAAEKKERQEREGKGQPMFVFGSKISDRVIQEAAAASSNGNAHAGGDSDDSKPKTAEELFKTAAQQDKPQEQHDFIAEAKEAAEKKKENDKPSTSIVAVMTGEENDINIFQTACKLHSFDKEKKTWVERGLSQIRINQRNEDGEVHHRIVARTTGNHRVVINSKVHADMLFERVDAKRLKISATSPDSNAMQIFLVTIGFSKTALNIDELCNILDGLIKKEKATEASKRKRKACEEPGEEKVAKMKIQEDDESKESDCSAEQKLPESSPPVNSPASKEDKKDEKEDNKESPQQEQSPEKTEKVTASSE
ncbi:hypothetical protein Y032_0553g3358 [Ancylostoma ceylanicum]|uniref:RanBD1 domain-containing protein n=1 Tax=Ancylostoma ceylanicum TaxID=53326 RepID=A0A016WPV2_9BILA|nr:hypothetical protein Y032_0553g3358 [Ancylostoma ceylanicum]